MMLYDMGYTIKNKQLIEFEQSFIFNFFLKRFPIIRSAIFTILVEIALVVFSSVILLHRFDFELSAIVSLIVALIHINGITQTRKFIKKYH